MNHPEALNIFDDTSLIELDPEKLTLINGGGLHWLVPVAVGAAIVEVISDWDNFEKGFSGEAYSGK